MMSLAAERVSRSRREDWSYEVGLLARGGEVGRGIEFGILVGGAQVVSLSLD
jgi:hypothetical protein